MRALTLLAAVFALSACGKGGQTGNVQNDESLTPESITSNDVTAIDAVTGADANMAADVDINFTNQEMSAGGNSAAAGGSSRSGGAPPPIRPKPGPKSAEHPAEPTTNTAPAINAL